MKRAILCLLILIGIHGYANAEEPERYNPEKRQAILTKSMIDIDVQMSKADAKIVEIENAKQRLWGLRHQAAGAYTEADRMRKSAEAVKKRNEELAKKEAENAKAEEEKQLKEKLLIDIGEAGIPLYVGQLETHNYIGSEDNAGPVETELTTETEEEVNPAE